MSNLGNKFILANKFLFDPNNNSLLEQSTDENIRLGSNESRILLLLAQRPNEVVTRSELHEYVWREQGFEVDDSSLTQAISTLRKLLKDPTKNPEFVKTVPKRGYQLICTVEECSAISAVVNSELTEDTVAAPVGSTSELEQINESKLSEATVETAANAQASVAVQSTPSWLPKVLLVVALLLPLFALFGQAPEDQHFRDLGNFEDTPVLTPINHPDLQVWLPSIEKCITRYIGNRSAQQASLPIKVIATGGQNNFLVLNYIHPEQDSGSSYSQQLVSDPTSLTKVCE
ncbi:winged helix-turn-helix domain-containing protein [Vibrio agarivorans]|uniref:Transcriptional regulator n=1 Tax=Vibrio agarivorans TaxID=153622 RepID=A0ABT7Y1V2_9VIBR|nr:transcriptional regulator [Vibrio agarivorans]MDN2481744.1 transcriptional regulator [Vibrio agarivorans]